MFHNVHLRHFGGLKMLFLIIRQRVLLSQWFWIYFCWTRNICIYHHFLYLNSDCWSSNTRIPYLMTCISMSNDERFICVLVLSVFHNVHFRHIVVLKMRFLNIRHRVLLSQWFGYTCFGIKNICKDNHILNVNSDY